MKKVQKLSAEKLKTLVKEELNSFIKEEFGAMKDVEDADEAEEVEASELADTLEKKVDMLKALKIKESKLRKELQLTTEKKHRLLKSLA